MFHTLLLIMIFSTEVEPVESPICGGKPIQEGERTPTGTHSPGQDSPTLWSLKARNDRSSIQEEEPKTTTIEKTHLQGSCPNADVIAFKDHIAGLQDIEASGPVEECGAAHPISTNDQPVNESVQRKEHVSCREQRSILPKREIGSSFVDRLLKKPRPHLQEDNRTKKADRGGRKLPHDPHKVHLLVLKCSNRHPSISTSWCHEDELPTRFRICGKVRVP